MKAMRRKQVKWRKIFFLRNLSFKHLYFSVVQDTSESTFPKEDDVIHHPIRFDSKIIASDFESHPV